MAMWDDVRITLTAGCASPDVPRRWLASDSISERKKASNMRASGRNRDSRPGPGVLPTGSQVNHPTSRRLISVTPYSIVIPVIMVI